MVKKATIALFFVLPVWVMAFQVELLVPIAECFEGESVRIEIQAFPAHPSRTSLAVESVPEGFSLAASRKERRVREDVSGFFSDRVDSVVFVQEWTTGRAGVYRLGPFVVQVDGFEEVLAPVEIRVQVRETAGMGELRWVLADPESEIRSGTAVRLILESRYIHEAVSLQAPLPKNALLERIGETVEPPPGSDWKPVASFLWTPLFSGNHGLPLVSLEYRDREGNSARVETGPRLVTVLAAESGTGDPFASSLLSAAFDSQYAALSDTDDAALQAYPLPELLANTADPVFSRAVIAWKAGLYAEALAHIRHLEHTAIFPASIRLVRRDAELVLGIQDTLPVSSAPVLQLLLYLLCFFSVVSLVLVPFRKRFNMVSRLILVFASFAFIFLVAVVVLAVPNLNPVAVSKRGPLRQIPEQTAGVTGSITEGTPVTVLKQTGSWYYVRLPAALEGWVSRDQIVPYTSAGLYGFW